VFTYNLLLLLVPRWANTDIPPLAPGRHVIAFEFRYDGPGIAKGGTGVLSADGEEVRTLSIPKTIPFVLPADETFDIGDDTRTGVNDLDYKPPFPFNGTIDKLTFKLGPTKLTEEEHMRMRYAVAIAND
jgi:arylsulfatase